MVHYNDLDAAVMSCLRVSKELEEIFGANAPIFLAKSDLLSAFRMLPIKVQHWRWLVMKAYHPVTGRLQYFVDKCLPFGASISCAHFQRFSNALCHIVQAVTGRRFSITNYLDDFLFVDISEERCNGLVSSFLEICKKIQLPVSEEKTEWASTKITFLGILLSGDTLTLGIPTEKRDKALRLLSTVMDSKKTTVKNLQVLTGFLNFLGRAVFPGRAFTRRIYAKFATKQGTTKAERKLKSYHHIKIDSELRFDCRVWWEFLSIHHLNTISRPMVDLERTTLAREIGFATDASAREDFGFGGVFGTRWIAGVWPPGFIRRENPSIEYLELLALCVALLSWGYLITDCRVLVHCDNQSVVAMVNNSSSSCQNCMYLIRLIVLDGLIHNRRVFARHIRGTDNILSDALSRKNWKKFRQHGPNMDLFPSRIDDRVWPVTKIWIKN